MIEILTSPARNTVQDLGRTGVMTMGVSRGGAMDRQALIHGNLLLANAPGAAGIEIAFFPFRLRFDAPTAFALTGAMVIARLDDAPLPPDWARRAGAGQVLTIDRPLRGARVYLCLQGGLDVPVVLGARATDLKGGFGGLDGRSLQRGDHLTCRPCPRAAHRAAALPPEGLGLAQLLPLPERDTPVHLRAVPGIDAPAFPAEMVQRFTQATWRVSDLADRAGYRLDGADPVTPGEPLSLFSHGITPGTVQLPPSGLPLVQMADANTCGGYPKIATVIPPDLRLLAQASSGQPVRIDLVDPTIATEAMRAGQAATDRLDEHLTATIAVLSGGAP